MIERNDDRRYSLVCDVCGEQDWTTFGTFHEAVDYAIDNPDWTRPKIGPSAWQDVCRGCQEQ